MKALARIRELTAIPFALLGLGMGLGLFTCTFPFPPFPRIPGVSEWLLPLLMGLCILCGVVALVCDKIIVKMGGDSILDVDR